MMQRVLKLIYIDSDIYRPTVQFTESGSVLPLYTFSVLSKTGGAGVHT